MMGPRQQRNENKKKEKKWNRVIEKCLPCVGRSENYVVAVIIIFPLFFQTPDVREGYIFMDR